MNNRLIHAQQDGLVDWPYEVLVHLARRAVEGCPEQEAARFSGPDESAARMGDMNRLIEEKVILKTLDVHLSPTRGVVEAKRLTMARGRRMPEVP